MAAISHTVRKREYKLSGFNMNVMLTHTCKYIQSSCWPNSGRLEYFNMLPKPCLWHKMMLMIHKCAKFQSYNAAQITVWTCA